jgi:multidrug efflux pump subunit AcrA (membrane-fusion protein)
VASVSGVASRLRAYVPGLGSPAPTFETSRVQRGDLILSVTATGPIATVDTIPLTFKTSGKLADLKVGVGTQVKQGQVLAILDTSDLQTALTQAQSNVDQAQKNYDRVVAGVTDDQKEIAQVSVDNAKLSESNAQASLATTRKSVADDVATAQASVQSATLSLTSAQHNLAAAQDQQKRGIASDQTAIANAQQSLANTQASVALSLQVSQQGIEKAKTSLWSTQISRDQTCSRSTGNDCKAADASVANAELGVNSAQTSLDQANLQGQQQVTQAQTTLNQAKDQLANDTAKLAQAVVSAQDQLNQAGANLANAQREVGAAQDKAAASIQSAQAQIDQASNGLRSAQASYRQSVEPPNPADVAAAKSQLVNAQTALATAQANLDAATLTAPQDATIAAINGAVGQYVSGGPVAVGDSALFTLVDLSRLKVSVLVNEADIGQVKVGDPATFTVSAYPARTFSGAVQSVQPIGTTVQNVVNYSVTCSITPSSDAPLFPGMTATATIVTQQRTGVVRIPAAALTFSQTALRDGLVQLDRPASPGGQTAQNRPSGAGTGFAGRGGNGTGAPGSATPAGPNRGAANAATSGAPAGGDAGANRGAVLVLENGKPALVRVGLGLSDGTLTEVTSGLNGGETLITGASGSGAARGAGANNGSARPAGNNPFAGGPLR